MTVISYNNGDYAMQAVVVFSSRSVRVDVSPIALGIGLCKNSKSPLFFRFTPQTIRRCMCVASQTDRIWKAWTEYHMAGDSPVTVRTIAKNRDFDELLS